MNRTVIQSKVGPEGVLRLDVKLEASDAGREVRVIVEPLVPTMSQEEWNNFVLRTAGAWKGDLKRPEQGEYEKRDALP